MVLLGSTGSIGINALKVAKKFNTPIECLSAGYNIQRLNEQIQEYRPQKVAILDSKDLPKLRPGGAKVYIGEEGICDMIADCKSDLVINALVGFAGLKPTFQALKCNKTIGLANKESLVSAGWLLDTSKIIPIDSEHFGLWYLQNNRPIKRLIITASGGAFRDTPYEEIPLKDVNEALNHPNWKMGKKITIDSASMVNKLFEVLEAYWLFGSDKIDAYIERTSNIHALIEFLDGSITAHFAKPDMKLPIAYAIDRQKAPQTCVIEDTVLDKISSINFESIDTKKFPLWALKDSLLQTPRLGVILNASNEIAVKKFLESKIYFGDIVKIITKSLEKFDSQIKFLQTPQDIFSLDKEIKAFVEANF